MRRACAGLVAFCAACSGAAPTEGPPAAPNSTGPFTDVTAAFGFDAPQADFASGTGNDCDTARFMTGAAAVGDVNGDGWPDVYLPRLGLPDRLMVNLAGTGFEDRAAEAGIDLLQDSGASTLFDRDADGDLDLLVTSPATLPRLFDNDGAGHFTEVDGAAGLVVSALPTGDCSRMMGASVADFDGDGDLDVLTSAWEGSDRSRLFENDGGGHFTDVSAARGLDLSQSALLSPAFVDLDLDGDLDLAALADFDDSRVYIRGDDGLYEDVTATSTLARVHDAMGQDLGDIDGDGQLDLFVTGICFPWNGGCLDATGWTGNHVFAAIASSPRDVTLESGLRAAYWAWGSAFFDPDLDGDLDLAVSSGYDTFIEFLDSPTFMFENDGAGHFTNRAPEWGVQDNQQSRSVHPFDFDGDGDEDLLVVNHGRAPVLYRNDLEPAGASLVVTVAVGAANPFGVGATVRLVDENGHATVRLIHANSRYGGTPQPLARFGGLAPNQTYTVEVWVGGTMRASEQVGPPLSATHHTYID